MNKKDIINQLHKEVGFLHITEEEGADGNLYITEAKFREIDEMLKELKSKTKEVNERIKFFKNKILSDDKGIFIKIDTDVLIKEKEIKIDGDLIIMVDDNATAIFSNDTFIGKNKVV